jgi:hypothetical protein
LMQIWSNQTLKAKSLNEGICECSHAGQICTVELLSKRSFTVDADLEVPTTKKSIGNCRYT